MEQQSAQQTDVAYFGGGCFWCIEAVYLQVRGVTAVETGYMGGHTADPTHDAVASGTTGHAQVVRVAYDPAVMPYRDLVEIFFTIHDPTTPDRQGKDIGSQYRSVIFTTSGEQAEVAQQVCAAMAVVWDAPIVTHIAPAVHWYRAEEAQQDYVHKHPDEAYSVCVVASTVAKFRQMFPQRAR